MNQGWVTCPYPSSERQGGQGGVDRWQKRREAKEPGEDMWVEDKNGHSRIPVTAYKSLLNS